MTPSTVRTYHVPDISCDHCVNAIAGEVGPLDGVDSVTVDLTTRSVIVVGGDDAAIRAAIDEAGYDIVSDIVSDIGADTAADPGGDTAGGTAGAAAG